MTRATDGWADRRARLSQEIEYTALRCILDKGVDDVTVEEIAAAAGISRRSFYRYFSSPSEVIAAMPRRSLDRIVREFAARPFSESIPTAFAAALRTTDVSRDEHKIREASAEILRRWPDAWRRALGTLQVESIDRYAKIIAARLEVLGEDPRDAGPIAATLSAVLVQIYSARRETGAFRMTFEEYERALAAIGRAFSSAPPSRA